MQTVLLGTMRGRVVFQQIVNIKANTAQQIAVPFASMPMGVLQFTLLDSNQIAQAERLTFVNPHKQLNIQIKPSKEK